MSFETALRARIKSADVIATGAPVEWVKRPQASAYPAVVMQVVSDPRDQTMTGYQVKRRTRVQIDVFALDAATKVSLREAVIAAVSPRTVVEGVAFERVRDVTVRDLSTQGETQFIHRDSIDAVFWWKTE